MLGAARPTARGPGDEALGEGRAGARAPRGPGWGAAGVPWVRGRAVAVRRLSGGTSCHREAATRGLWGGPRSVTAGYVPGRTPTSAATRRGGAAHSAEGTPGAPRGRDFNKAPPRAGPRGLGVAGTATQPCGPCGAGNAREADGSCAADASKPRARLPGRGPGGEAQAQLHTCPRTRGSTAKTRHRSPRRAEPRSRGLASGPALSGPPGAGPQTCPRRNGHVQWLWHRS